eukprot:CAMPEP_0170530776 /NCGR_PEP_ID=MMETSP0209-20121228/53561_1 /TAXON_ID=665100 ORGANISM="Litonotus pictus, Strain P1" /NCGR_SAMPLE_ID=MMETSP0209 /ASSEMBLY_ACC=CAM_ASM_000301 /LENGTH=499 /DNA_ID=CAMNT_0010824429 /DNA_START=536 /DNA_END=2035 /DNA_ORIENTATION=+
MFTISNAKIPYVLADGNSGWSYYSKFFYVLIKKETDRNEKYYVPLSNPEATTGELIFDNMSAEVYEIYQFGVETPIEVIELNACMSNTVYSNYTVNFTNQVPTPLKSFATPCPKCTNHLLYYPITHGDMRDLANVSISCRENSFLNGFFFDVQEESFLIIHYRCRKYSKATSSCNTKIIAYSNFNYNGNLMNGNSIQCTEEIQVMREFDIYYNTSQTGLQLDITCCCIKEKKEPKVHYMSNLIDYSTTHTKNLIDTVAFEGGMDGAISYLTYSTSGSTLSTTKYKYFEADYDYNPDIISNLSNSNNNRLTSHKVFDYDLVVRYTGLISSQHNTYFYNKLDYDCDSNPINNIDHYSAYQQSICLTDALSASELSTCTDHTFTIPISTASVDLDDLVGTTTEDGGSSTRPMSVNFGLKRKVMTRVKWSFASSLLMLYKLCDADIEAVICQRYQNSFTHFGDAINDQYAASPDEVLVSVTMRVKKEGMNYYEVCRGKLRKYE